MRRSSSRMSCGSTLSSGGVAAVVLQRLRGSSCLATAAAAASERATALVTYTSGSILSSTCVPRQRARHRRDVRQTTGEVVDVGRRACRSVGDGLVVRSYSLLSCRRASEKFGAQPCTFHSVVVLRWRGTLGSRSRQALPRTRGCAFHVCEEPPAGCGFGPLDCANSLRAHCLSRKAVFPSKSLAFLLWRCALRCMHACRPMPPLRVVAGAVTKPPSRSS